MKPGHGQKFSRQQETAIVALLSQPTLDEAARYAKVGSATLWRWLKRPDFQEAYRQARREALAQATGQLQQAASLAVSALKEIIQDRKAPASSRVTAARTVLEIGFKSAEIDDIERRLADLERVPNQTKKGKVI